MLHRHPLLLSALIALTAVASAASAFAQGGAAPAPRSTTTTATPAPAPAAPNALPDLPGVKPRTLRATTPRPTPPASSPSPRLRPLDETGQQAEPPGDLRPERPVAVPQVSLPLGRTPPSPTPAETRAVDGRRATSRNGIDDSAARCMAQSDPQARARCANR